MHKRELDLSFDSEKGAKIFFESIGPELEEKFLRSSVKMTLRKNRVNAIITASDKTALRASENSIMKPYILFNQLKEIK
ncbi:MAG: KEOPS complex subunit Pcc1 [archaeon]|jgi:tRNA threonylcarbamoyladenosine modification (KEOPS) complex  Pcc1 subunit